MKLFLMYLVEITLKTIELTAYYAFKLIGKVFRRLKIRNKFMQNFVSDRTDLMLTNYPDIIAVRKLKREHISTFKNYKQYKDALVYLQNKKLISNLSKRKHNLRSSEFRLINRN